MRCNPARWLWGLIPVIMLTWAAFEREREPIEVDIEQRTQAALTDAGYEWARVSALGRDVTITGLAPKAIEPKAARDVALDLHGVRVARLRTDVATGRNRSRIRNAKRKPKKTVVARAPEPKPRYWWLDWVDSSKKDEPSSKVTTSQAKRDDVEPGQAWWQNWSPKWPKVPEVATNEPAAESNSRWALQDREIRAAEERARQARREADELADAEARRARLAADKERKAQRASDRERARLEAQRRKLEAERLAAERRRAEAEGRADAEAARRAREEALQLAEAQRARYRAEREAAQARTEAERERARYVEARKLAEQRAKAADAERAERIRLARAALRSERQKLAEVRRLAALSEKKRLEAERQKVIKDSNRRDRIAAARAELREERRNLARARRAAAAAERRRRAADEAERQSRIQAARAALRAERKRLAEAKFRAAAAEKERRKREADERKRLLAAEQALKDERKKLREAKRLAALAEKRRREAELAAQQDAKVAHLSRRKTKDSSACERRLRRAAARRPILFDRAKADIDSESSLTIARLAEIAKRCRRYRIEVEGHTDSEGTPERNQRLSERRARAVVRSLIYAGLDRGRLTAVGYGAGRPVASNSTAEGMARNRRIEFRVYAR